MNTGLGIPVQAPGSTATRVDIGIIFSERSHRGMNIGSTSKVNITTEVKVALFLMCGRFYEMDRNVKIVIILLNSYKFH